MSEIISESIEEIEAAIPLEDVSEDLAVATDHLEQVSQGTIDTIDGMEGYSLTDAQRYLNSVLYANGDIPASVEGNESVLSTVKGWASKAIAAIKRAFAAIWNYFFGKKNVEEETKLLRNDLKLTVEKVNAFKQKAKKGPSEGTSGNVVIQLANNYSHAADEVKATDPALAREYETAAEKLKENPVITSMSDSRIVMDQKLYKKIKAIAHAADQHAVKCGEAYLDLRGEIHDQANLSEISISLHKLDKLEKVVDNIHGVDDITKSLAELDNQINKWGISQALSEMKRTRSRVDAKIKRFESEIPKADAQEQKALRNDISDMQLIGRMVKSVISNIEAQLNAAKRLAKMLPKLHRLPA